MTKTVDEFLQAHRDSEGKKKAAALRAEADALRVKARELDMEAKRIEPPLRGDGWTARPPVLYDEDGKAWRLDTEWAGR